MQVNRIDGFAGPIQLRVDGLPEFVQCGGQELANSQNRAILFLQAKEDAPAWHGPIRVVATYELNGQPIETSARVGTLVWGTGDRNQSIPVSRMTREMMVSVVDCEPEPIQVTRNAAETLRTSRGVAAFEIPVNLTRRLEFNAAYASNATGLPGEIKPAGPVQFAENGNEGKLVLNLANANVRPGSYRIWLQGDLTYKQARNPQAITQAQERQKQVEAWTAEWQAKKDSATALLAEEPAKIAAADKKAIEAQAVVRTQDQSLTATAEALAKTGASLRSKREELATSPENQALVAEVKQLGEAFDQQASAVQASMAKRQQAKESLIAVQAERAALDQQIAEAKQVLSEVDAKLARLTELKQQADAQLDAANKANQPVDRTYAAISLPIDFEVVATPLALDSSNAEAKAGEATQLPAKIGREFGFADAVQVAATLPNGVPGLAVAAGTINADQTEVQLGVTTTAETPPGEYPVTLKATAKFNNVDVEATTTVMIKINPAA